MSIGLSNVVVVVVPMVTGGIEIGAVAGKFWVIGLLSEQTEFVATSRLALPAWLSEASFPRYRLLFVVVVVVVTKFSTSRLSLETIELDMAN